MEDFFGGKTVLIDGFDVIPGSIWGFSLIAAVVCRLLVSNSS